MRGVSRPNLRRQSEAELLKEAVDWVKVLRGLGTTEGKVGPWLARQVHTTTGWLPGLKQLPVEEQAALLKRIKSGPHLAQSRLDEALKGYEKAQGTPGALKARKALNRAKAEMEWANLTGGTIPGAAKAMVSGKAMPVLRSGWRTLPGWGKGLTGYFGYLGAKDVASTPSWMYGQPGFEYKSRLHHLGSELGSNLGFIATGGLPIVPMMLASEGARRVGGLPGRLTARTPEVQIPPEIMAQLGYGG